MTVIQDLKKRIAELEEELEQAKLDKCGAEADLAEANRRIAKLEGELV